MLGRPEQRRVSYSTFLLRALQLLHARLALKLDVLQRVVALEDGGFRLLPGVIASSDTENLMDVGILF
jgi:hypothetical protein